MKIKAFESDYNKYFCSHYDEDGWFLKISFLTKRNYNNLHFTDLKHRYFSYVSVGKHIFIFSRSNCRDEPMDLFKL